MRFTKTFNYIPAQPGFSTVEFMEGEGPNYLLVPIIGWEISNDTYQDGSLADSSLVSPVTIEGTNNDQPVVFPDGRVCTPNDSIYDSVNDWVKSRMEQQQNRLAAAEKE